MSGNCSDVTLEVIYVVDCLAYSTDHVGVGDRLRRWWELNPPAFGRRSGGRDPQPRQGTQRCLRSAGFIQLLCERSLRTRSCNEHFSKSPWRPWLRVGWPELRVRRRGHKAAASSAPWSPFPKTAAPRSRHLPWGRREV